MCIEMWSNCGCWPSSYCWSMWLEQQTIGILQDLLNENSKLSYTADELTARIYEKLSNKMWFVIRPCSTKENSEQEYTGYINIQQANTNSVLRSVVERLLVIEETIDHRI